MKILNFAAVNINYIYSVDDLGNTSAKTQINEAQILSGGKGFKISVALAKAGFSKVYQAGILGEGSENLIEELKNNGVNTSCVKTVSQMGGYSLVFVDKYSRSRTFYLPGAEMNIDEDFINETLKRFSEGDYLIFDDSLPCREYLITAAAEKGIKICYCPDRAPTNLDNCDYVFLTSQIAYDFSGKTNREELIEFFRENFEGLRFIVNFQNNGYLYVGKTRTLFQPCFEAKYFDESSGFDAFIGYFLALIATGRKLFSVMKYSAAAAAYSVLVGSKIPEYAEISANIKNLKEHNNSDTDRVRRLWSLTEKYIDNNIADAKIGGLSKVLGYSEAYTGELIKTVLGVSFSELLQKKRCVLAAKMLKSTQLSVNEIIKAVGYDNETFFRNKFKLFFGMTPREYRKNR